MHFETNKLISCTYLFIYTNQWIDEVKGRVAPYKDFEIFEFLLG